jgi:hypothetical protein
MRCTPRAATSIPSTGFAGAAPGEPARHGERLAGGDCSAAHASWAAKDETSSPSARRMAGETAKSTAAGRTWLGFHAPTTASSSTSSTHFPGSTGANASRTARRSMRAMAPSLSEPTTVVSRAVLHCANPGHTEAVRGSWIRSPRPARGTRPPTAAPLAPQPPARSVRDARSAPTHAPP